MSSTARAVKRPPAYARLLAAFLSLLLGLGPIATPAYAAVTALADQPLGAQVQAKPNIILTVDDSTSMLYDFLPDITVGTNCRDGTGARNAPCGWVGAPYNLGTGGSYLSVEYTYEQYGFPFPAYTNVFTTSGPGAGCNLSTAPPTCSPGISPGPPPGIKTYPTNSGSPQAGRAYEYWLLWPAPAHNSAMNALYYNPMLTYSPPVASDGTPYPSMNAGNTTGWTLVPANPFLHLDNPWGYPTDPLAPLVDLTATVTVGQWCNSDWTQGNDDSNNPFATNQSYCRSNGNLSAADSDSTPANIGDYNYPWAPASITSDYTTKVDMSTINITSVPPVNATVKPAWANAETGKYFYENDNVLWCDISSPAWPQTGSNPLGQTCINKTNSQTCVPNPIQPTCGGGSTGTCNGAIGAGSCNNPAPVSSGTCNGGAPSGQCNGYSLGVCSGYQPGTCAGGTAPTCNNIPGCGGFLTAACSGQTRQACNGYVAGNCSGFTGQACNGGTQIACNPQSQVCNGYGGPQVCNLTLVYQDPSTCPSSWVPPGCNLDPDPESGCQYIPVCTPTYTGACSISNTSCQQNSDCPIIYGTCSVQTSKQCSSNSDCTGYSACANNINKSCSSPTDCGTVAGSGTCSATGGTCTVNPDGTNTCPQSGTCNNPPGLTCTASSQCTTTNGTCAVSNAPCVTSATCDYNSGSGTCNYKNSGGTTNGPCTQNTDCVNRPNTCSTSPFQTCSTIADCTPGTCVLPANQSCTANNQCTGTGNTCQNSGKFGNSCNVGTDCTFNGTCTNTNPPVTACQTSTQCTRNGTCAVTNATCTSTSSADPTCKVQGSCSTGNVGAPCFSSSTTDTACAKSGACSYDNTKLCANDQQCPAIAGTCAGGTNGSCNVDGDCTKGNTCTNSSSPANTSCTQASDCAPLPGTCSDPVFGGNACTTSSNCAPIGVCSIVPTACVSDSNCQPVNGPLNPILARCDTTGVSGGATATLLADANGPGLTCRRNNHAYADGTTASRYNYPGGRFTTPVTGEITAGMGCSATAHYTSVPRHYWKTSVEWCDTQIASAGDEWNGYGDSTQGTCQASSDVTHIYPRFYQFGSGTDAISNYTTAAFAREDLTPSNTTFTHSSTDSSNQTTTVTRTYAQEMENYANWFAYYRTRIQAVKSATSLSFLGKNTDGTYNLDETKFRVGLHTLSNVPSTSFVNIQDFDLTQKALWATQLFGINIQLNQETPSLDAMSRIGDYFTNGTSSSLSGSTDPIVLSCQKNWHMFFTDGITNQPYPTSLLPGDTDNTVPVLPDPVSGLTSGTDWPPPFRENSSTATSNSLSDYATQYWSADLRPTGPLATDNVPTTSVDPANWQHLNFAALSLGTQGKLAAGNQAQVQTQLAQGTLQWPVPYPSVNKPDASGVDDLWHAAINGRGRFVNAKSVAELQVGMGQILADALNSQGARSGASFTNSNLSTTSNTFVYETTFQPSWGGTLAKYLLAPDTGLPSTTALWHAETQLATMLTPTLAIPDPWRDTRIVVTMNTSGTAVPFLWANLSTTQQDALAPGNPSRGQLVLAYLRGDQSNEGTTLGQFRQRDYTTSGALGDIVDSSAIYVGPPNMPYKEIYDAGYTAFKSTWISRPGRVYVGANDGMLHGFDDATGNETFAYVPQALFRPPTDAGLGSLTYQFGGLPPFVHHFFVDSTPTITDVVFGDPSSENWHSLLVGGLGKGGQAYYAIDVTNPGAITNETLAAGTVKWEFTNPDLGYTYGPALVTKVRAFNSDGKWVVVVPSGYNNASGIGRLWFLDPETGAVLATMSTGDGSPTDPSGLAQISGYTQNYPNYLTDQIYAGDLHGNLWRFDIMDTNPANWVVNKLATLTDPSGTAQPVTVQPQMQIDTANGTDRWVFIGTGKLLDDSDLANTQVQTFYAMLDGTTKTPSVVSSPIVRSQLVPVTDTTGLISRPAVGWYQDLTDVTGQRVVTTIAAADNIVAYAATSPNTDPCITGQPAEVFVRGYSHGNSVLQNADGSCCAYSYEAGNGAVGLAIVALPTGGANGGSSANVPQLKLEITGAADGKVTPVTVNNPPEVFAHRMSWRVLNE